MRHLSNAVVIIKRISVDCCCGLDEDVCLTSACSGEHSIQTWLTCNPFSARAICCNSRKSAGAMKASGAASARQENAITMTMVHRIIALEDILDTIPVNTLAGINV